MPINKRRKINRLINKNQYHKLNGQFSNRIELCVECVALPLQAAAAMIEIIEEDVDEIYDDGEIWTELSDVVDVVDNDDDDVDVDVDEDDDAFDAGLEEELISLFDDDTIDAKIIKHWRKANHNANIRGAGSSKSTFYRIEQVKEKLKKNAKEYSSPIHRWMPPADISDDLYIGNAIENPVPQLEINVKLLEPKFTITTAMDYLILNEAKISKSKLTNEKMAKNINFWNYICSLSFYQYFALLR